MYTNGLKDTANGHFVDIGRFEMNKREFITLFVSLVLTVLIVHLFCVLFRGTVAA